MLNGSMFPQLFSTPLSFWSKVGSASLQIVTDQVEVTNHLVDNMQFVLQDQVITEEAERLDGNLLEFDVRSKAV